MDRVVTARLQTGRGEAAQRLRIAIRGAVQGVGFRPFIYRLATEAGLKGWVNNSSQGVFIEVEGARASLESFLLRIEQEKPPRSFIQSLESSFLDAAGYKTFEIRASDTAGQKTAIVLPDIATCKECLSDVLDPANRRYLYPFTNCTNCGPRFTIIRSLPYDRPNTTMQGFEMCDECRAEYENPLDRRFHAQPNACPACGPHLELWDGTGRKLASREEALNSAAEAIRRGGIVAVKGLGGFQLMVDARNDEAVRRLRKRKRREEKPFALMFPDLEAIAADMRISDLEERLLTSPESPIVLIDCDRQTAVSRLVAPGNPYLGVMLPYTPLHYLLMDLVGFPVVATSGNLSDEPICTDENEAIARLGQMADLFLIHNRPIARHVDDSIVRVMMGRELVLRRARGYAPLPIHISHPTARVIAVGAHLKNTIAASADRDVFLSQHIGDLETAEANEAFQQVIESFTRLYELRPSSVACDAHPGYISTQHAEKTGLPVVRVQHHYAHVLSCMAENRLQEPVLGIAWDGTGLGTDGTIWGGEFLRVPEMAPVRACDCSPRGDQSPFQRVAHLGTFRLPGGERAIREPRRSALGLLYEVFGDEVFEMKHLAPVADLTAQEAVVIKAMLEKGLNAPVTSSAGRLFDAVAAIAGLRQKSRFEGQAAMELEFALEGMNTDDSYELEIVKMKDGDWLPAVIIDWAPMIKAILEDVRAGVPVPLISVRFHNALVEAMVMVARRIGEERVVLTGGCFQNRYLTERAVRALRIAGFRPYWHQRVPPNDGGISLGQVLAASREGINHR